MKKRERIECNIKLGCVKDLYYIKTSRNPLCLFLALCNYSAISEIIMLIIIRAHQVSSTRTYENKDCPPKMKYLLFYAGGVYVALESLGL